MKKTCLSILLISITAGTIVFAGGGKQAQSQTANIAVSPLNVPDQPWLAPYAQTVVMTTANSRRTTPIDYELPTDNEANNALIRAYKKYLNIDVREQWNSDEYSTQLNLTIASGNLPDVFKVNNAQFTQLMEAGMLEDITDAYEKNASVRLKKNYNFVPAVVEAYKKNGRLFGFPMLYGGDINNIYHIFFRKDWMAELGYKNDPKTVDEMIAIVQAMNNKYGTKGIAVDKTLSGLLGISQIWHAAHGIWIDGPNGIVYGSVQPEMRTALAAFADWYKRGLINPNFATDDHDAVKRDLINGKYGAQPFQAWWGFDYGNDIVNNNNKNAYFEPYQLPSVDSKPVRHPLSFPNGTALVVKKGYKNTDAVVKLLNFTYWMMSDAKKANVFAEKDLYNLTNIWQIPSFSIESAMTESDGFLEVQEAKKTGNTSVISENTVLIRYQHGIGYLQTGDTTTYIYGIGALNQLVGDRSAYGIASGIIDRDEFIRSRMWGATPEDVSKYGSTLNDMLLEGFTLIITGQQPISYFDTLVKNWYSAGGQEMTDAVNKAYRK